MKKQRDAAEQSLLLAKSQRIPDVTFGVEFDGYGSRNNPTVGFGFSLGLPLFNRNQGEIVRKTAEKDQISAQIEKLKRQILLDVRTALNNFESSLKLYETYSGKSDSVHDLLKRSEQAFALGGITVMDFLDTEKISHDFTVKLNQLLVQTNLNDELLRHYAGGNS